MWFSKWFGSAKRRKDKKRSSDGVYCRLRVESLEKRELLSINISGSLEVPRSL